MSLRRGPREHVYLIVIIIPLIALTLDKMLFAMQRSLFPSRYGGAGLLHSGVSLVFQGCDRICSRKHLTERAFEVAPPVPPEVSPPKMSDEAIKELVKGPLQVLMQMKRP